MKKLPFHTDWTDLAELRLRTSPVSFYCAKVGDSIRGGSRHGNVWDLALLFAEVANNNPIIYRAMNIAVREVREEKKGEKK